VVDVSSISQQRVGSINSIVVHGVHQWRASVFIQTINVVLVAQVDNQGAVVNGLASKSIQHREEKQTIAYKENISLEMAAIAKLPTPKRKRNTRPFHNY
jgi:hypothetical protein